MQQAESMQQRKAALLVHALPDTARQQVLQRLSVSQRMQMEAMLSELRQLGIPKGRDWLSMIEMPRSEQHPDARIGRLNAEQVHGALAQQPIDTIALMLAHRDWPWASDFLAKLPADKRIRVQDRMGTGIQPAPKLIACLVRALDQQTRLPAPPNSSGTQPS